MYNIYTYMYMYKVLVICRPDKFRREKDATIRVKTCCHSHAICGCNFDLCMFVYALENAL